MKQEAIEFARILYAMTLAVATGQTKLSKSATTVIFSEPACGRNDLSGMIERARAQMAAAGIDYSTITAAEALGLSESDWDRLQADKSLLAYRMIKRGRKWLEAQSIPDGFKAKILINDISRDWQADEARVFAGDKQIERSKYGSSCIITPHTAEAASQAQQERQAKSDRKEIARWLGYVEAKVPEGYVYQKGVDTLRSLGIADHPDLQARLDAALKSARAKKTEIDASRSLASLRRRGSDYLGYIRANLENYWYEKGELTVRECSAGLESAGYPEESAGLREQLEQLRQKRKDLLAQAENRGYAGPVFRLHGGSGYGCQGWAEGQVVHNSQERIKAGEPEFLLVLSAKSTYYADDGLSFGVGDDRGRVYSAVCRAATDDESAPLKAEIARAAAERQDRARLEEIKRLISETGDRPDGPQPEGDRMFDTQNLYGGGDWLVLDPNWIWYVQNNGSDGDFWSANNVRTGGAGAIGWRVPRTEDLAAELTALRVRLERAIVNEDRDRRMAAMAEDSRLRPDV